jgi:cell shape-determining protein MreC
MVAALEIYGKFSSTNFREYREICSAQNSEKCPHPEYYNKEVKRLKVSVRRAYNRRKSGERYQAELKRLSEKLWSAKRNAQETLLPSVLQNESKFWSDFYRYVKTRK